MADFFDVMIAGDGEPILPEICDLARLKAVHNKDGGLGPENADGDKEKKPSDAGSTLIRIRTGFTCPNTTKVELSP